MIKRPLFLVCFLLGAYIASPLAIANEKEHEHEALVAYSFGGLQGNEYRVEPELKNPAANASTPLQRGKGLNYIVKAQNTFCANGWTRSEQMSSNDYYTFTVGSEDGMLLNLESIDFTDFVNAKGPGTFVVRSSLDDYTGDLLGPISLSSLTSVNERSVPLGEAFQGLREPVTFRLYAWGSKSGGSGVWGLGNPKSPSALTVRGTVTKP